MSEDYFNELKSNSAERAKSKSRGGGNERAMRREAGKFEIDRDGNFKSGSALSFRRVQRYVAQEQKKAVREAKRAAQDNKPVEQAVPVGANSEPTVKESAHISLEGLPFSAALDMDSSPVAQVETVDVELCDGSILRCVGEIIPPP